ncbi:MAG: hypothetical protein AAB653_02475 [Patescibacteria group bacterium]
MPLFRYKTLDKNNQTINGLVEDVSKESAEETIKEKGLSIIKLIELSSADLSWI